MQALQNQSPTIHGLIFDFDGLMLDTEVPAYQSWQEIYAEHGCTLTMEIWSRVLGGSGLEWDHIAYLQEQTGRELDGPDIRKRRLARKVALIGAAEALPGVLEYIREGKLRGLKLAVVSSSPHAWVDGYLEKFGIRDEFDIVVCAEDAPRCKPYPDLYEVALAAFGLSPVEAIVFEDSPNGISAAQAAGIFCVVVPNAISAQMTVDHADMRMASLAETSLHELVASVEAQRSR